MGDRRFGAAEQLDALQVPVVVIREREVLLSQEPRQRVGQEHVLELDAHRAWLADLTADVGAALVSQLVEYLPYRHEVDTKRHVVVPVLDDARVLVGRPQGGDHQQGGHGSEQRRTRHGAKTTMPLRRQASALERKPLPTRGGSSPS